MISVRSSWKIMSLREGHLPEKEQNGFKQSHYPAADNLPWKDSEFLPIENIMITLSYKILICDKNGNCYIMGNGMGTKDNMAYRASVPKLNQTKLNVNFR